MRYAYPAIFTEEQTESRGKVYTVEFPDILGCVTEGESIPDAIEMAREALTGCIISMQTRNEPIPEATLLRDVRCNGGSVHLIEIGLGEP